MNDRRSWLFAQLSEAVAGMVSSAAPALTAIRTSPYRHCCGFLWDESCIVTSDQALPPHDSYVVVLSTGELTTARPGPRDPTADLALLRLDQPVVATNFRAASRIDVGSLALALGAALDGSPTMRITAVHRLATAADSGLRTVLLDLPGVLVEPGGPVLDAAGGLIGMAHPGANHEAMVVPHAVIARFVDLLEDMPAGSAMPAVAPESVAALAPPQPRRGWLGLALQPITVPEGLAQRAGQSSGRLVMNIIQGGPADRAGLRVGDVLLALNGHNTTGSHALRAFLGSDRIGSRVEVRLLRDGILHTASLTVAAQTAE